MSTLFGMKKIPWQTLTLVASLVALACGGFFAGYQWPRDPPAIEIATTPEQAELKLALASGNVTGHAPATSTLMLGETVVNSDQDFSVPLDAILPLKWWGEGWAVILDLPKDLAILNDVTNEEAASDTSSVSDASGAASKSTPQGNFVASKSGTKYHPIEGCSFADRIKPENKIYFSTEKEAQAAGYEPSTCLTK